MLNPALEVRGLVKGFGPRRVLDGVDLALPPGRVTVLLGENGAGKSTLLRCLLGTLRPESGAACVLGLDPVRAARRVREQVGWVPDTPDAEPWMDLRTLLAFLQPFYPTWNAEEALRLAAELRVPLRTPFARLSRGEGLKAMIVAALAPNPPVVLLDEPLAGLDPLATREVLRAIVAEVRTASRTVLCATHDLAVAARIADDVAILHRGRIARYGTLGEVLGGDADGGRGPARLLEVLETVAAAPGGEELP